jgi:CubicO group peptidase (beta-lactamase class C family)
MAVQHAASQDPNMRAFMVIENGSIVSSYLRDDVDPKEPYETQSVTKSWMSFLVGTLVDDGLLSLDKTLGDICPEDDAWADVNDGSTNFRKEVTVDELLTMTSGLATGCRMVEGVKGGNSLQEALSWDDVAEELKGEFRYNCDSQLMSYIITRRTGMTPRQYQADRGLMRKLGIGEDEYDWVQNLDGVELGGGGLRFTPMQMAKLGQLYLQGGRASPSNDEHVVLQEWIDASFTRQTTMNDPFIANNFGAEGEAYGYLWWGMYEYPSGSTVYCAMGGPFLNWVCVDRDIGRVVVQHKSESAGNPKDNKAVLDLVFENSLSFRATMPPSSKSGKGSKKAKMII